MEGGAVISTDIFSGETVQEEAKETKNGTLRYSTSEWATEESVAPTCTQKPLPDKQNLKHFSTSTWMYTQFCRQEDLMVHCGAVRTTQWPLTPTANLKSRFRQSQHAAGTNMGPEDKPLHHWAPRWDPFTHSSLSRLLSEMWHTDTQDSTPTVIKPAGQWSPIAAGFQAHSSQLLWTSTLYWRF